MAEEIRQGRYGDNSIVSLKDEDRVRKKPSVVFGSDGLDGCKHSIFEIVSNSLDEAREGFGNRIIVTVQRDHSVTVEDFGRGVPMDFNARENRYNWELIYCELYASGKYENNSDKGAYKFSLGTNGLGACATQYTSEYMDVYSHYEGTVHEMHFKKGRPVGEYKTRPIEAKEKRTGTVTHWRPDLEVFSDIRIDKDYYVDMLHRQAVVNAGIRLVLRWQEMDESYSETEFFYKNGISDYVKEHTAGKLLSEPCLWKMERVGRDREDRDPYMVVAEICFATSATHNFVEYYHNSSPLEHGGSSDHATRKAFVATVDKYLTINRLYAKNEPKITYADIEAILVLVINSFSSATAFENQTKKAITNTFIETALTDFLKEKLEVYFAENQTEAEAFCVRVLENMRFREKQERERHTQKIKAVTNDPLSRVGKFAACRSRDPERRELYIVEGDSAMSSCKLARDAEFQAIIPIRGKTLNCLKWSEDRIFKSDIIMDLVRVIGCGIEGRPSKKAAAEAEPAEGEAVQETKKKPTKQRNSAKFDLDALRWSKIIICTDADEDGYQIRTLLLTMFYRLLPTLIQIGKIYIAESPLFEITCGKDTYFAYNEAEKVQIVSTLGDKKYTIQRSKGLGENEPDMMSKTTMNPESRRLIRVNPSDAETTAFMFETLLGDDIEERKKFIAENAHRYMSVADF